MEKQKRERQIFRIQGVAAYKTGIMRGIEIKR